MADAALFIGICDIAVGLMAIADPDLAGGTPGMPDITLPLVKEGAGDETRDVFAEEMLLKWENVPE